MQLEGLFNRVDAGSSLLLAGFGAGLCWLYLMGTSCQADTGNASFPSRMAATPADPKKKSLGLSTARAARDPTSGEPALAAQSH